MRRLHTADVVAYLSPAFPAHSAGWFHPPVSASPRRQASRRLGLAARDQARRLPDHRPQGGRPSDPLEPPRHEFHRQVAEGRGGGLQFGGRQRPDRWRGGHVSLGRAFRLCRPAHKGGLGAGVLCRIRSLEPQRRGSPSAPARGAARRACRHSSHGVDGILFSEALAAEGALVFAKACELGLEGIVSKRAGSRYRSGTSRQWLKSKNPAFVRE